MKKTLALLMVLALTACIRPNNNQNEEEFAAIDESPARLLDDEETTSPLLQYTDSITKVYPEFYDNIIAAKSICEDFKGRVSKIPGILEGSAFKLDDVVDASGTAVVDFIYDGTAITLHVICVGYDREKASRLSKNSAYIIKGGTLADYEPLSFLSEHSINLGDVYVKDLQVEAVD